MAITVIWLRFMETFVSTTILGLSGAAEAGIGRAAHSGIVGASVGGKELSILFMAVLFI